MAFLLGAMLPPRARAAALATHVTADPPVKFQVSPQAASRMPALGGQLIADYGSFQVWEVAASQVAGAEAIPGACRRSGDDVIELHAGPIQTTVGQARLAVATPESYSGKRLRLVQFAGPVKPEWREALVQEGWRVVAYLPRNAYLVYGEVEALTKLRVSAQSGRQIQWEGPYQAAHKVHPGAQALVEKAGRGESGGDLFAIQLVEDPPVNTGTLQLLDQVKRQWLRRSAHLGYVNCVLRLPPEQVAEVAARPDVVSIQPYLTPEKRDERQAQILTGHLSGNQPAGPGYLAWLTSKGFAASQFEASGFVVDVCDSGVENGTQSPGHFGLYRLGDRGSESRLVYNRLVGSPNAGSTILGCDGHGTLNAHIIAGYDDLSGFPHTDAAGFHHGLGVCPFVRVGSSVVFDPDFFTEPDYVEIQSRAYQDGARISCNSWGANLGGAYSMDCQIYDALVRDAQPAQSLFPASGNQEMVIVFSAGNSGPGDNTVGSPAASKNIITVGASEGVRSLAPAAGGNSSDGSDGCSLTDQAADSADDMADFSSRGPCDDGRAKPDLVAPGTHIVGGVAQEVAVGENGNALACYRATGVCALPGGGVADSEGNFFPLGQEFFTVSSGTSHSCPAVGAGAALLRQYFINHNWAAPSPAMTKAWLMSSARYLSGVGANDSLPSNNQGMGAMRLGMAFDGAARVPRDQRSEDLFTGTGQTRTFTGFIADAATPFRVTLAWTDAPGSTSGNAYNNDLNLAVTVGGQTYSGNVFSGGVSVTGGSADAVNNVESVFLPAGVSGAYTITIIAANINSDGVPNNATSVDQDFALLIYNANDRDVLLSPAGVTIAAESCPPGQGSVDPGETVTVELGLRNLGPFGTKSLTGTLLPVGGVIAPSGAQDYGLVAGGGVAVVTRPFTFVAGGDCGDSLTLTLQLQDGTNDYGLVEFPLRLGQTATNLSFFSNSESVTIGAADGNVSPYPSTVNVAGVRGGIAKVTVTLNGLSHAWPDDLDLVLVGPQGQAAVLFSDVGGANAVSDLTLTLDGEASASLPNDAPFSSGTWRPADFESGDELPLPVPAGLLSASLDVFAGTSPNGPWRLCVVDDYPSDDGGVLQGGWTLTLATTNSVCCADANAVDVGVSATCYPVSTVVSNRVTYVLTVTNRGPADATGVVLSNRLSDTVAFRSASLSQGEFAVAGEVVTCALGAIPAYGSVGVTIEVEVLAGPQLVCESLVSAAEVDSDPRNNAATASALVPVPALTLHDASVVEGDGGKSVAVFLFALSRVADQTVTVDYWTVDETAWAGGDYLSQTNHLTFLPGEVAKTIVVEVVGDGMDEPDETFRVVVGRCRNAVLANASALGTILDDDPMPALSAGDAAAVEGNAGMQTMSFPLTLSGPSGYAVSVTWSTFDGVAQSPTDYFGVTNQSVVFPPGAISTNLVVLVRGDTLTERDEDLLVRLANSTNATLADDTAVGTIVTDDLAPMIKVAGVRIVTESESPANGVPDPGELLVVSLALRNEGSADTADLRVRLAAGGGVASPGPEQSYGVLVAGGLPVSRTFTFTVEATNCSTITCSLPLQDVGVALDPLSFGLFVGNCLLDDFDPDLDRLQWMEFGGTLGSSVLATNYGGSISGPNALWFGAVGSRYAVTRAVDTRVGGTVEFWIRLAGGTDLNWEQAELPEEGVVLECTTDDGGTWTELGRYASTNYQGWTRVIADIPEVAQARATHFRWRQLANSGLQCDHWALDEVRVVASPQPPSILTHPASQSVGAGETVSFEVVAVGSGPLTYQWWFNHTNHLAGQTNATLTLTAVAGDQSGEYAVTVGNLHGTALSSNATLTVIGLSGTDFQIVRLGTENSRVVEHLLFTGDDRGGLAASATHIFCSGDTSTARFALDDLSGALSLGSIHDGLVGDLRTEQVYALGNGTSPLGSGGGTVSTLIPLDATLQATGRVVTLSQAIPFTGGGIFAGFGRVMLWDKSHLFAIELPGGMVTDFGEVNLWPYSGSETWAFWGVAESWAGTNSVVYVQDGQTIARTTFPGGVTTIMGTFEGLSDMACFTVSLARNRWYFHHEYGSQFGGEQETLGYADAVFARGIPVTPPVITVPPASQAAMAGDTVTFEVVATGTPPLQYEWRFNGTNVPGATNATWTLAGLVAEQAGAYSVRVASANGSVTSTVATLSLSPVLDLADSLDTPGWLWTTAGDAGWVGQGITCHDALDAARCGNLGHGQEAWLQATVTGPGSLSFWWKVSSESCCDALTFWINDAQQAGIGGEVGWAYRSFSIPAGTRTVRWRYAKDAANSSGQDRAWVDQVSFVPALGAPDHFAWSSVDSKQVLDAPFPARITAQDAWNNLATNFTGMVTLTASESLGAASADTILSVTNHTVSSSGTRTVGYAFTPNVDLTVTHVRHYFGTKVSLWTDGGTLLLSQNVTSAPGDWTETELATPVQLTAGTRYRLAVFTGGTSGFYRNDLPATFEYGTLDQSYENAADTFPNSADAARWWLVDLRYAAKMSRPVALKPNSVGPFTNGVWSGYVTVLQLGSNVVLRALDAAGHKGSTPAFAVVLPPDPPSILTPPANQTAKVGDVVVFSVGAAGAAPLSYQWRHNGANLLAGDGDTLTLNSVTLEDAGDYWVVVTNAGGVATSSVAVLTVMPMMPPSLSFQRPSVLADGTVQLLLGNAEGLPVTAADLAQVRLYSTTNLLLPFSSWEFLTNPVVLTNGVIRVDGLNVSNAPGQFFRSEQSW